MHIVYFSMARPECLVVKDVTALRPEMDVPKSDGGKWIKSLELSGLLRSLKNVVSIHNIIWLSLHGPYIIFVTYYGFLKSFDTTPMYCTVCTYVQDVLYA